MFGEPLEYFLAENALVRCCRIALHMFRCSHSRDNTRDCRMRKTESQCEIGQSFNADPCIRYQVLNPLPHLTFAISGSSSFGSLDREMLSQGELCLRGYLHRKEL